MKRLLAVVVCMALGVGVGAAQKERYSQTPRVDPLEYPLTVHVTSARLMRMPASVSHGDSDGTPVMILHLTAVVDGARIELETGAGALLHHGDYRARVVSVDEKKSGWFTKTYELLFSDRTHVVFTEVGESE